MRRIILAFLALAFAGSAAPALAQMDPAGRAIGAVALATAKQGYISPKRDYNAAGDCSTVDDTAFANAAAAAVAQGKPMRTDDACYALNSFTPPAGLVWRSDYSQAHKLLWKTPSTGCMIDVTAAVDLDGLVIDGNRSGAAVRASASTQGSPMCVRGSMVTDAPARLPGVNLGRVWIYHTSARAALPLVNTDQLQASEIRITDSWGAGLGFLGGNTNATIKAVIERDIGGWQNEGSRFGQVLSYFVEPDPSKSVASWYVFADRYTPSRNILPQARNHILSIDSDGSSDTGVYSHDFIGAAGIGNSGPTIDVLKASHVGKDAIKQREGATDMSVGAAILRDIGNRFVVNENLASGLTIGSLDADGAGVDALGLFYGTNMAYDGTAVGQTLSTSTGGISCNQYASKLRILSGSIRNVKQMYSGAQGHGAYLQECDQAALNLNIDTTDGQALRISNSTNFRIDGTLKNGARLTATSYFSYVHNDGTTYGAIAGTATTSTNSRTVTGSGTAFSASLYAGQELYCSGQDIGQVAVPLNSTTLTLVANALATVSGASCEVSWKKGLITASTGSSTVTGSGTTFLADLVVGQSLEAPAGRVCRVKAIASNTSLTCGSDTDANATANAGVAVAGDVWWPGESARGTLRLRGEETSGAPVALKFQRMDGFPTDMKVEIAANPKDYTDSANGANTVVMSQLPTTGALNIDHRPIASYRGRAISLTTDASCEATVAHGQYTTPATPLVRATLASYAVRVAAVDANNIVLLLVPPAADATNYFPNPSFSGAVAGAPGTMPTGMGTSTALTSIRTIGAVPCTETNACLDVTFNGNPGSSGVFVTLMTGTALAASAGDTWTMAGGWRITAGDTTNLTDLSMQVAEFASNGTTNLGSTSCSFLSGSTSSSARTCARTLTALGTAHVVGQLRIQGNGGAVNFTLRLGGTGGGLSFGKSFACASKTFTADVDADVGTTNGW